MKQQTTLLLLILVLAPLISAETYNENEVFSVEKQEFNISTVSSNGQVYITNEHRNFFIRENDCKDYDIYLFCVNNITDDIVENYPHRYSIDLTVEKLCEDCVAWGQECTEEKICQGKCVHNTCRPRSPWCGDNVCDEGETTSSCPADCAINQTTQENQTSQSNQTLEQEPSQEETQEPTEEPKNDDAQTNNTNNTTSSEQEENTTTNDNPLGSDNQPRPLGEPTTAQEDTNWLAAGLVIFGGLASILVIFNKKKKRKDDLYSYRK